MLVAGSVLALLLMGLTVDGLLTPSEEEGDDTGPDNDGEDPFADQSGTDGGALAEMLFGPDGPDPDTDTDTDTDTGTPEDGDPAAVLAESRADAQWTGTAEDAAADGDFLSVDETTSLLDGTQLAYVPSFDTGTDTLVLDFEGTDPPEITVEHDAQEDAAIVLANDHPVSLVEGAPDLTADHVRVVMTGAEGTGPEADPATALPGDTVGENTPEPGRAEAGTGPLTLPPAPDLGVGPVDTISDGVPGDEALDDLLDRITSGMGDLGNTGDMLDARAGIDPAFGTGGEDALTGGLNNDQITGGAGQDALFGGEGQDRLIAGDGNDELHGDTGNDDLQGGDGVDFLDGGEGDDTLDGGTGRDLLFGGDGDDVIHGGAADDFLQGGMGADTLNGGSGNDVLDGTFGSGGDDRDGGDILLGGTGDDILRLGEGDVALGGAGEDTFIGGDYIENAEVAGTVADFDPSEDKIEVLYDPGINPYPVVEIQDFADGSGADILLNGEVILSVSGAQGMDPNLIDLRAVA